MKNHLRKVLFFVMSFIFSGGCILTIPEKNTGDIIASLNPGVCPPGRINPFRVLLEQSITGQIADLSPVPQAPQMADLEGRPDTLPDNLILGMEEDRRTYTMQKMTYPSSGDAGKEVITFFYRPKGEGFFPLIVILPIIKGDYYTGHLAEYLAGHGFSILRLQSSRDLVKINKTGREALGEFRDHIRFYVADIIRGIDLLQSRHGDNIDRVGVLGISQGAVIGSLLAGLDSRVQSGVILLGGGGLAGILHSSEERSIIKIRENILRSKEIRETSFIQEAEKVLSLVDPLTYAGCIQPSRVLLVNALFDRVIRPTYSDQLWERMGRPARIQVPTGHYTAGLFLPYIRPKVLKHFQETLGDPNP